MAFVDPVTLEARGVRLVPLALEHEAGLQAAAADGELWKLRVTSVPEPHETRGYIETALTTAKLLLMSHAFETLGAKLVGWRTDNYNFASQKAIERLGARKDGVLRHHALRRDGTVRDTVMYSLAAGEWPEVKAHLQYQLARPRA